jgi:hypothetical protein
MTDIAALKAAVHRGTTDAGYGEGDPTGIVVITEVLRSKPDLVTEAVKLLKARIKDRSPTTSYFALDLLDQCMRCCGFPFQLYVTKKVLSRILKLALPNKGNHPNIQAKAASLIRAWANDYGSDGRLCDFATFARELSSKEEVARRDAAATVSPVRSAITAL